MNNNKLGIYIHVPFCIRKCPYCGFYSEPVGSCNGDVNADDIKVYKNQIIADIARFCGMYSEGRIVDSIFFGGGTPTVLTAENLEDILGTIKENFTLSTDCEISIEANPGTIDKEKLTALRKSGFNRLSIGVQSFDDGVLNALGRIHSAEEAEDAFKSARKSGFDNINLDLMFGIPGQSISAWDKTLEQAIALKPEHISAYSLQLEEGTRYFERFQNGEFEELPDEIDREMYHRGIAALKDAGYKHYEISNFSLPGFECRHNLKYWTLEEYLGIGPSASSYIDGKRFTFRPELYTKEISETHENSDFDDMSEYAFTGLRLTRGISYGAFKAKFGRDFRDVFSDRWEELKPFFDNGDLVQLVDNEGTPISLRLTEQGIDISNRIFEVFV